MSRDRCSLRSCSTPPPVGRAARSLAVGVVHMELVNMVLSHRYAAEMCTEVFFAHGVQPCDCSCSSACLPTLAYAREALLTSSNQDFPAKEPPTLLHLSRCILSTGALGLLALPLALPTPIQASPGTLLRYHWVVGAQIRQRETDTTVKTLRLSPPLLPIHSDTSAWRYTTIQTVTKVYPDGSGMVRTTFSGVRFTVALPVSVSRAYLLTGYFVDQRISTRGTLLNQTVHGALPADMLFPSSIARPIPLQYAAAPVTVGSTWQQLYFGTERSMYQVRALGSLHGQPTVTFTMIMHQPLHSTVFANGLLTGQAREEVVTATGALVTPFHAVFIETETINAVVHGKKLQTVLTTRTTQDGSALP